VTRAGLSFRLCLAMFFSCLWPQTPSFGQPPDEETPHALTYRFAAHSRQTHVAFELNANKIYIPVRVNNAGPYWFILDTGSISNAVDTEIAKSLGIKLEHPFEASGGGEKTVTGAIGSNVSLDISELELKQAEIDVEPVNAAISAAEGRRVDGLLGYDFLSRFVVKIDYMNQRVDVFEPADFHYTGSGEANPFEIIRGNIFVSTSLTMPDRKRVPGSFMVDTGWRSALTLTSPFVADQKLMTIPGTVDAITGMGIGGATIDTMARIPGLQLGGYKIENFLANFSHAKAGVLSQGDFSGIIGAEVLRRFTVIFDYPHRKMILEPNARLSTPYEFDMSGLFITSEGGSSKAFKIYSVVKDSPGAGAGMQEGDIIESIDNIPASSFTLEKIRQMFKAAEGREHRLTVSRNGRVFTAKLRLRRII
jgi:hypothetical protein